MIRRLQAKPHQREHIDPVSIQQCCMSDYFWHFRPPAILWYSLHSQLDPTCWRTIACFQTPHAWPAWAILR